MCLINTESLIIFIQELDLLSSIAGVIREPSPFCCNYQRAITPEEPDEKSMFSFKCSQPLCVCKLGSSNTLIHCTTIHRSPFFSGRYSVMCKVYTEYQGTSEIEHGFVRLYGR